MKKMIIFEPAMCCSTGVCGPSINKELLRISTIIDNLKNKGILIERYNLSGNPQIFADNKTINKIINKDGIEILPVTMIDGVVVKSKDYPTNEEFCKFLGISQNDLKAKIKIKKSNDCGCNGGCC
ncbi:arsenite efflux transporter metallochaperone ArsD [Clostridium tyrobutyricum]|jgi:hypothetical protein|uniref:arsenite efflux transporter metallochaperone ArsD n=1 Tax=Clostridium tyrobutyricum TaxID=1519 RepID=UPI002430F7F2|nr:arsenite efflux transporter metallochaperone ArsD [Clostridium tyrobutyricum]